MQLIIMNDDKSIQFVPSQTDLFSDSHIVDKLPVHFKKVSVTRRRRSNGEDIEEDRIALCKTTLKAQNIPRIVTIFMMVSRFQSHS